MLTKLTNHQNYYNFATLILMSRSLQVRRRTDMTISGSILLATFQHPYWHNGSIPSFKEETSIYLEENDAENPFRSITKTSRYQSLIEKSQLVRDRRELKAALHLALEYLAQASQENQNASERYAYQHAIFLALLNTLLEDTPHTITDATHVRFTEQQGTISLKHDDDTVIKTFSAKKIEGLAKRHLCLSTLQTQIEKYKIRQRRVEELVKQCQDALEKNTQEIKKQLIPDFVVAFEKAVEQDCEISPDPKNDNIFGIREDVNEVEYLIENGKTFKYSDAVKHALQKLTAPPSLAQREACKSLGIKDPYEETIS